MRKLEATTHVDGDSISHHYKGGRGKEDKLTAYTIGAICESRDCAQKRNGGGGAEMYSLPTFSQKRIFEDWAFEIDCRIRGFGKWAISEVADQMVAMLGMSESKQKLGSYKKMVKIVPFVLIG